MRYTRILCGNSADPTILSENGKFYMTISSLRSSPGLILYESADLLDWNPVNAMLRGGISDGWAPELCKIGQRYFVYFPSGGTNYVIWSDDLYGNWSDPVCIGAEGLIDPGYVRDVQTGQNWLFFNAGYAAPLSDDGLSLTGAPRIVYPVWQYPHDWETEGMCCESPKLFYRNGFYHLTLAQGGTAGPPTSHMAVMLRSKRLDGGWEPSPYNPVLHTYDAHDRWWSVGHATPFETPDGWKFVLHAYERGHYNEGRQILLCNAEWTPDGWLKAADSHHADMVPGDFVCDFTESTRLPLCFSVFGSGGPRYAFSGIALVLDGKGRSVAESHPLLINHTAGDFELTAEFAPSSDCREFGLTFFYSEACSAGICLKDGTIFSFCLGQYHRSAAFRGGALRLRIRKRGDVLSYFYGDGDKFVKTEVSDEVSAFHHNVFKGFLSLRPGVYAAGSGRALLCSITLRYIR